MSNGQAREIIVKVQLPIVSNSELDKAPAFIYNRDRSYSAYVTVTPEIIRKMRGQYKEFFHAGISSDGRLELKEQAVWQNW